MKKKKGIKISFIVVTIVLIVIAIMYQHKVNLNINNSPPSQKWSKGKFLDKSYVTTKPIIIKEGKDYIITYNDKNKLKILVVDELGRKIKKKYIPLRCNINNLAMVKGKENYYIEYVEKFSKNSVSKTMKLDKNFNVLETKDIPKLREVSQIGDSIILRTYEEAVEIIDAVSGNKKFLNMPYAKNLQGIDYKGKYIIAFTSLDAQEVKTKCIFYENGKFSKEKDLFNLLTRMGETGPKITISVVDDNMYFLAETSRGGRMYTFPINSELKDLDELKYKYKDLGFPGIALSAITKSDYYKDKGRILVEGTRQFGINKKLDDVVEYSLKDGDLKLEGAISKSTQLSTFSNIYDDIAIYCDFEPKNDEGFNCPYNIYMTSSKEEFKKQNNFFRSSEKNTAIMETITGSLYSLIYILIIGSVWIFPGLTLMGIFNLKLSSISERNRKIIYAIVLVVTTIMKVGYFYIIFYKENFKYLPKEISSPVVGITILIGISIFCYVYSYLCYKDDTEDLPIVKYLPYLLVDTLISLLIFSPYL